jgi:ABC-type multidrug transport system fused ATPase/permease subunit
MASRSTLEPNLYRYIIRRSLRPQLALTVIALALGLGLNPWTLTLTKEIINKAIGRGDLDALLWLCGSFLVAVLAQGGLKYVKQNLEGRVSESMLRDLRSELYQRILRFPLPHFRNTSTGQLVAMMLGEVEDIGQFFGEALSLPLFHGAMLLGSIAFMVSQNPWMALAGMTLFPVQIWLVRKLQRRVTQLTRERVKLVRTLSDASRSRQRTLRLRERYAGLRGPRVPGPAQRIFGDPDLQPQVPDRGSTTSSSSRGLLPALVGGYIITQPGALNGAPSVASRPTTS